MPGMFGSVPLNLVHRTAFDQFLRHSSGSLVSAEAEGGRMHTGVTANQQSQRVLLPTFGVRAGRSSHGLSAAWCPNMFSQAMMFIEIHYCSVTFTMALASKHAVP